MSIPSLTMSSRTYPKRKVQPGGGLNLTVPGLRVASGSREDPIHHTRADQEAARPEHEAPGIPLTREALTARGDSVEQLRRRVAVTLTRSACPASLSTVAGAQDDLKRRMDDYMLHTDYHQSILGEDAEDPIEALGSPLQTDMDCYYYSGTPTDLAETASLPRRPRGSRWPTFTTPPCKELTWRAELPTTTRTPEAYPAYVEGSHIPTPASGALHGTADLLAKLLSGSEDPGATALSEVVRAKLGISEPLTKPALASPSPALTSFADDLKGSRARSHDLVPFPRVLEQVPSLSYRMSP